MKAMILAAGLGTRLQPITNTLPKALVPVNGVPIIDLVVKYLRQFDFEHIIVNVHHHSEQIINHVHQMKDASILISDESALLKDTGGALVHALDLIGDDTDVLIFNTDVLIDLDLNIVMDYHRRCNHDATLLVQDRKSSRMLALNHEMQLVGWKNFTSGETIGDVSDAVNFWGFSGIHIVNSRLIYQWKQMYAAQPFSVIKAYLVSSKENNIYGFAVPPEVTWLEIGSPARLNEVNDYLIINPQFGNINNKK